MRIVYMFYCAFIGYGDFMNVDLGVPYEAILKKAIEKGYAGNQTEVIRQALLTYERMLDEEEVKLVNKGIELEMQDIREGKLKTKSLAAIKKKYRL
jgi:Arc/MetJ-type ribon-helix-helix transcriptional regulator